MTQKKTAYHDFNTEIDGSLTVDEHLTTVGNASVSGTLTVTGAGTYGTSNLVLTAACANTLSAGLAWTTGLPVFSAGQAYITLTAGGTRFRIPVWLNA